MIICLHGLGRSGKDTAADHLVAMYGMTKDSFGLSIYEESAPAFGVHIEEMQSNEWKTIPQPALALRHCHDSSFVETIMKEELVHASEKESEGMAQWDVLNEPRTSRFILQRWATEYRRAQDPLYWVKTLADRMEARLGSDTRHEADFVISDLREDHEVAYLLSFASRHNKKLRVIEVLREGTINTGHGSDAGLPWKYIDTRIQNQEGELDAFLWSIRRTYMNIKGIK